MHFFPWFSLFLSTFQLGTLPLFLTSLSFLNADSSFFPVQRSTTCHVFKEECSGFFFFFKKRNLECMNFIFKTLHCSSLLNRGHKDTGKNTSWLNDVNNIKEERLLEQHTEFWLWELRGAFSFLIYSLEII